MMVGSGELTTAFIKEKRRSVCVSALPINAITFFRHVMRFCIAIQENGSSREVVLGKRHASVGEIYSKDRFILLLTAECFLKTATALAAIVLRNLRM